MLIVETHIFTKLIAELLTDEEYRTLQNQLVEQPELGPVIPGTRGLRKLRLGVTRKGKRGGARLIYYYLNEQSTLYMVFVYKKNEVADLTKAQLKLLIKQVANYIDERESI